MTCWDGNILPLQVYLFMKLRLQINACTSANRFCGADGLTLLLLNRLYSNDTRRISATPQACAAQPRGECGSSASKISEMLPTMFSLKCSTKRVRMACDFSFAFL